MIIVTTEGVYPTPLSDKDKALVEAIYNYVINGNGISPMKAGKELTTIHRALHTTVFKLFVGWCRQMAVDHYRGRLDRRNLTISRHAADIYDFMMEKKIIDDSSYIADTMES